MDVALFAPTCESWALKEAGVTGYENVAQDTGANFYASMCFLYQDNFLEISKSDGPPLPPPSPAPPLLRERLIVPIRIFFAGGFKTSYLQTQKLAVGRVTGAGERNEEIDAEEGGRDVFQVASSTDEETLDSYTLPNRMHDDPYRGRKMYSSFGSDGTTTTTAATAHTAGDDDDGHTSTAQFGEETIEKESEYVDVETSAMVIEHCTDNYNTVCQTAESDQTLIKVLATLVMVCLMSGGGFPDWKLMLIFR